MTVSYKYAKVVESYIESVKVTEVFQWAECQRLFKTKVFIIILIIFTLWKLMVESLLAISMNMITCDIFEMDSNF